MSKLHALHFGSETVHKDTPISKGAFSLNGHDSSYVMSAKKAVLKVPTLGRKSTNIQSTEFRYSAGQQYSSSLLVWRLHAMPIQGVTCHFSVEAFIVINHLINHCIFSMYCLDMFRYVCHVHLYFMSPTF